MNKIQYNNVCIKYETIDVDIYFSEYLSEIHVQNTELINNHSYLVIVCLIGAKDLIYFIIDVYIDIVLFLYHANHDNHDRVLISF